jgi:maltooligosyltrehalose synthase
VPRLIVTLSQDGGAPLGRGVWDDTRIALPDARPLRDVFTGAVRQPVPVDGAFTLEAAAIFDRFPVALLVPADPRDLPDPRELPGYPTSRPDIL